MVKIEYSIDSDEYELEINPTAGDVDEVYRSQDRIREHVESNGYEFADSPPKYRIIAKKHKQSRDPSVIDLGDLSGKVDPIGEADTGVTEPETDESESEESEPDQVEVTIVGPEGDEETRAYNESQNLGSLKADIKSSRDDIDRSMQVKIYRSRERQRELQSETQLSSLADDRLFWDAVDRL